MEPRFPFCQSIRRHRLILQKWCQRTPAGSQDFHPHWLIMKLYPWDIGQGLVGSWIPHLLSSNEKLSLFHKPPGVNRRQLGNLELLSPAGSNEEYISSPVGQISEGVAEAVVLNKTPSHTIILNKEMFKFQLKVTHHKTNQEELRLNEKDNDANAQIRDMLELSDKDFRADF